MRLRKNLRSYAFYVYIRDIIPHFGDIVNNFIYDHQKNYKNEILIDFKT